MKSNNSFNVLLHPIFLLAVLVLLLNDHLFKEIYPTYLTGKLSDFAGLFVFSVFSSMICEKIFNNDNVLWINYSCIALLFILIKVIPIEQWFPISITGFYPNIIADKTDLMALSILPVSYYFFDRLKNGYTPHLNKNIKFLIIPLVFYSIVATSPPVYKYLLKADNNFIYNLNDTLNIIDFENYITHSGYNIINKDSSETKINYILKYNEYIVYDSVANRRQEYKADILYSEYYLSLYPSNYLTINNVNIICYLDSINNQMAFQVISDNFVNNIKSILK